MTKDSFKVVTYKLSNKIFIFILVNAVSSILHNQTFSVRHSLRFLDSDRPPPPINFEHHHYFTKKLSHILNHF